MLLRPEHTMGMVLKSVVPVRLQAARDPPTGIGQENGMRPSKLFAVVTRPLSAGPTCQQVDKDGHALVAEVGT